MAEPGTAGRVRYPLMDGMRAIAALCILLYHSLGGAGGLGDDAGIARFVARLNVGVPIFFVISGFLLYRPWVAARIEGTGRPRIAAYAWRRALRIVPAYWVALTIIGIWLGLPDVFRLDWQGLPIYYGFLQIYQDQTFLGGIFQAWTLGVEVAFYATLPLLALGVGRLARRVFRDRPFVPELAMLAALVVTSLTYRVVLSSAKAPAGRADGVLAINLLPGYLDHFALGMGLAVLSVWVVHRGGTPRWLKPLERRPGIAWALALLCFLMTCFGIGLDGRGSDRFAEPLSLRQYVALHALQGLCALFAVLPAVVGDAREGRVRQLLGRREVLFLGTISYGIYLWHAAIVIQLGRWGATDWWPHPYVVLPSITFGATVVIAWLSWRLVEEPVLRLKRRVPELPPREPRARAAG